MNFTDQEIAQAKEIMEKLRRDAQAEADESDKAWRNYGFAERGERYVDDDELRQLELRAKRCKRAKEESAQKLKDTEKRYAQFLAEVEIQRNSAKYGKEQIESTLIWHDPEILEPRLCGPYLVMLGKDDFTLANYNHQERHWLSTEDDRCGYSLDVKLYAEVALPNVEVDAGERNR
jgi:hypothetical protein